MLSYVRYCFLPVSRSLLSGDPSRAEQNAGTAIGLLLLFPCLECLLSPIHTGLIYPIQSGVVRAVSGKLSELEVELQRSQRSVDIPQVKLEINRQIAQVCKQVQGTFVQLAF